MSDRYTEREWLEGLRYEDKFPDDECEQCHGTGFAYAEIECWYCDGTGKRPPITTSAGAGDAG